ncbi:hypothetical protein D3C87_1639240 [compost metagenome]
MVREANHRCRRLIRASIEDLELGDLPPGGVREIEEAEFFRLLKIENWKSSISSDDFLVEPSIENPAY